MANHPTAGRSTQGPVRLFLAVGMIVLIGLVGIVATGILTPGSQNGAGAPAPAPVPTGTASDGGTGVAPSSAAPSETASEGDGGPSLVPSSPAGLVPPPRDVLASLIGSWRADSDTSLLLTISRRATFRLANGTQASTGYVVREGSTSLLIDADLVTSIGEVSASSADHLDVVPASGQQAVGFTRIG